MLTMHLGRRPARGEDSAALRAGRWSNLRNLATSLRTLGPYVALALTLPGGTLIALTLFGMRHRNALPPLRVVVLAAVVAASVLFPGST
jgi:hypothetical protein